MSIFNKSLPLSAVALVTLSLFSCAKDDKGSNNAQPQQETPKEQDFSPLSDATRVGNLAFDNGLTQKHRGAFVAALDYLQKTEILNADAKLLSMMRIKRGDAPTLRAWIEDRVQYIMPGDADLDSKFTIVQKDYKNYENPGVVPPEFAGNPNAESKAQVVMSNIGAAVYLIGKTKNVLIGLKTDNMGTVNVTSPRTGILRAGDGLFMVPSKYTTAVKVFHLTTLIHESRHSDGNKTSTGFLHAKCVDGDYVGQAACDHNTNGPYIIEALATNALMNNCRDCSAGDKRIIEILYADGNQRQIVDANLKEWDDAPEGRR